MATHLPTSHRKSPDLRAAAKPVFAMVMLLVFAAPVFACPMCKDSTVDTGKTVAADSSGLDFNKSIYIMLGGFVGAVGFTGRMIFKAVKSSGV